MEVEVQCQRWLKSQYELLERGPKFGRALRVISSRLPLRRSEMFIDASFVADPHSGGVTCEANLIR